jgi:Golgi apparatus protein 1
VEVEKMMADRAADFRLDAKLRKLCQEDIADMCGYERDSLDTVAGYDARVIQCLQDYRDEILNPGCKSRVLKIMEYASSDIRFDVPLAEACFDDRQDFCSGVPPGSARVIRCLQDKREDLSYECRATLFDQEVNMAENIDFQFPMKKNCSTAIDKFCKNIPHGHARVIRCLQENLDNAAMPEKCKVEVAEYTAKTANDYRLNYRLSTACHDTITENCADACNSNSIEQPCGGTVLQCLSDKMEEITSEDCKKEVFYFQKMEVKDFRNDVILAETCRSDVDTYCAAVEAGEGRVHKCLWDNKDKISTACKDQERKIQIMQSSNTELMPNLAKACKAERAAHCKGVRPGKSRVYSCLVSNSDKVDFTEACKDQLTSQQKKRVRDHRMDYDLRTGCKNDVPKVCAGEIKEEDKETGAVLKCLVKNVEAVSDVCSREISRSLRAALQFYQSELPVLDACDADVKSHCLAEKGLSSYRVGEIRKCLVGFLPAQSPGDSSNARLLRKLLEAAEAVTGNGSAENAKKVVLQPACKEIVQLAEPGDAFSAFTASMNASAIASHVKSIEAKFGLKEGTLTPRDDSGILTLTGWSAVLGVLAIIAVAIGAGVHGYRKYHGLDGVKGYIRVNKGAKAPSADPGNL